MNEKIGPRLTVVECRGSGALGTVYVCRHSELNDKIVAVKVLFADVISDAVLFARFKEELITTFNVQHPNLVQIYEFMQDEELAAYSMEYVEGEDLSELLGDLNALNIGRSLEILVEVVAGLGALHSAGLIHGNLKPENVLIGKDGSVKLSDYGLTLSFSPDEQTEGVSIDYFAPEYLESGEANVAADIYAVGVLAYEMLTGRPPYFSQNPEESAANRVSGTVTPVDQINARCPASLNAFVLSMIARDPKQRPRSADDVIARLRQIIREELRH